MNQLNQAILKDIDAYCVEAYKGRKFAKRLGASSIGDECSRKLWYGFRWVKSTILEGRQYRLFNRGHREEDRFIEWLRGIGCRVWADDLMNNTLWFHPESDCHFIAANDDKPDDSYCENVSDNELHITIAKAKGVRFKQYPVSAVYDHFAGRLDAIIQLPDRYNFNEPVVGEFKTSSTGRVFTDVKEKGVAVSKPQHYAQMCIYGKTYGFERGLYLVINKNDDDIACELVKLNYKIADEMLQKAERIITSQTAPPKLSLDETFYKCKYCDFVEICHKGAVPEINCRSCVHAVPAENAEWHCEFNNGIIPEDFIPIGCKEGYKAITQNV